MAYYGYRNSVTFIQLLIFSDRVLFNPYTILSNCKCLLDSICKVSEYYSSYWSGLIRESNIYLSVLRQYELLDT